MSDRLDHSEAVDLIVQFLAENGHVGLCHQLQKNEDQPFRGVVGKERILGAVRKGEWPIVVSGIEAVALNKGSTVDLYRCIFADLLLEGSVDRARKLMALAPLQGLKDFDIREWGRLKGMLDRQESIGRAKEAGCEFNIEPLCHDEVWPHGRQSTLSLLADKLELELFDMPEGRLISLLQESRAYQCASGRISDWRTGTVVYKESSLPATVLKGIIPTDADCGPSTNYVMPSGELALGGADGLVELREFLMPHKLYPNWQDEFPIAMDSAVTGICCSGGVLAASDARGNVRAWNVNSGKYIGGTRQSFNCPVLTVDSNENLIAAVSRKGGIDMISAKTLNSLRCFETGLEPINAFLGPRGVTMLMVGREGTLTFIETGTGKLKGKASLRRAAASSLGRPDGEESWIELVQLTSDKSALLFVMNSENSVFRVRIDWLAAGIDVPLVFEVADSVRAIASTGRLAYVLIETFVVIVFDELAKQLAEIQIPVEWELVDTRPMLADEGSMWLFLTDGSIASFGKSK